MKERLRIAGAWGLIVLGVAGCVLPIIPGIPILAAGVAMLGKDHWLVRRCGEWLRKKGIWPRPGRNDQVPNVQCRTEDDRPPGS
jgi:uncharacterized protein